MILVMDFLLVHGKMKNNNILITVNKNIDINKLKELGITKFAFPLKGFCVGIPDTFLISEINTEAYIYVNRIFDNEGIDKLKEVIYNLPKNIKGIIFDDLGVLQILKDINIEKILYLTHFNNNTLSVNYYLTLVDSVILSTDITMDEIDYIIQNSNKLISLFTFGYVMAMYSRRKLLTNYTNYHNLEYQNKLVIDNTNKKFIVYENEFGTVMYHDKVFNGYSLLAKNCLYNFINSTFLTTEDVINFLTGTVNKEWDEGFLYQETIYRLKGDLND